MPKTKHVYQELATLVDARHRCAQTGNVEWFEKHADAAKKIVTHYMPSGSGIDCGTALDLDKSTGNRLVFRFSYHHMDEMGGYAGWTEHELIVTPNLITAFDMRITGRDRNGTKEYLYDIYGSALHEVYTPLDIAELAERTAVDTLEDARNEDTDAEHMPVPNEE